MARPSRCRRVCDEPACLGFLPQVPTGRDAVILTVDEYEAVRLVDYEKRTHEQCAAQMGISRTTVTEIYEAARFKISDSLVNGKPLLISGGHYRICRGDREYGCGRNCRWILQWNQDFFKKGEFIMRIAVPYENGEVFQHFGHSAQFKLYDADEGKILQEKIADATGSGHGALAGFLSGLKVDVLICGGIGAGAKEALSQQGIQLYGGVSGSADDAVRAYLSGSLQYNPDIQCTHHDHHGHDHHEHGHHGCHHHCGEDHHGCSGNNGSCGRS